MGRRKLTDERRTEIAEGLYRCIVKRGYAGTTVRDIAREADVRPGIIHHYFENKDEILSTLTALTFDRHKESLLALLQENRESDPRKRLRMGIDFIFLRVAGDRDLIKVFHELWDIAEHHETLNRSLQTLYREYRNSVSTLIRECFDDAAIPPAQRRDLAAFLVSASEGASIQWFINPRGLSLRRLATLANRMVESVVDAAASDKRRTSKKEARS
ncbi:MAG: TetR family transcriptional regulator C-terminal domain-containing protein [Deltaproteobacteria bacterium]|nr:TetR family transcriptional regulator C-terminal domain-containing protein [Deltaproteobacteria bacterium]